MENYLYFSDADGADATGDAGLYAASRFIGVSPHSATVTRVFFEGAMGTADANEMVSLTHIDTTTTADDGPSLVGHQSRIIANAIASALMPQPKQSGGMKVMVDLTSGTKFAGLEGVTGVAITIDS
tara:strand:- start:43 stop:420 length:378 start_codon:yes stop_codon:yes gene_type:complete